MRTIEATTVIDAPPSAVWRALTAGEEYSDWNPFITSVSGDLAPGSRPTVRMAPPGKRAMTFRPRITDASPEKRLRWIGHLVMPGLCDAEHEFLLTRSAISCLLRRTREAGLSLAVFMIGAFRW